VDLTTKEWKGGGHEKKEKTEPKRKGGPVKKKNRARKRVSLGQLEANQADTLKRLKGGGGGRPGKKRRLNLSTRETKALTANKKGDASGEIDLLATLQKCQG